MSRPLRTQYTLRASGSVVITAPVPNKLVQRDASDQATITVSGNVVGVSGTVEASWLGGAWQTIQAGVTDAFSSSVTLTKGSGMLAVRCGTAQAGVIISCGDLFLVIGQSNAVGYAQNYNTATTWVNDLLAHNYCDKRHWTQSEDPANWDPGQIFGGSAWPGVANTIRTNHSVPAGFINAAVGGTTIGQWVGGLYADAKALYTAEAETGIKAALWFQGESDEGSGTSQATYSGHLDTIVNSVQTDMGVDTVVARIHKCPSATTAAHQAIVDAQNQIIGSNVHALAGPDLSGITISGLRTCHFYTDAEEANMSDLWAAAIEAALY